MKKAWQSFTNTLEEIWIVFCGSVGWVAAVAVPVWLTLWVLQHVRWEW
jgi:hypothetical protein